MNSLSGHKYSHLIAFSLTAYKVFNLLSMAAQQPLRKADCTFSYGFIVPCQNAGSLRLFRQDCFSSTDCKMYR